MPFRGRNNIGSFKNPSLIFVQFRCLPNGREKISSCYFNSLEINCPSLAPNSCLLRLVQFHGTEYLNFFCLLKYTFDRFMFFGAYSCLYDSGIIRTQYTRYFCPYDSVIIRTKYARYFCPYDSVVIRTKYTRYSARMIQLLFGPNIQDILPV